MIFRRYSLLALLLLLTACGDCADRVGESDIFEPLTFGEYEFDGEPNIVAPKRVLFGDLEVGRTGVETVTVQNTGDEVLKFSDWNLSQGFEMRFLGVDGQLTELGVGQSADLIISHTSLSSAEFRGQLRIDSNDPDTPNWEIELFVNARFPCLETIPEDLLDFGEVEIDQVGRRPIVVRNCSTNTITSFSVDAIRGNRAFSVPDRESFQRIDLNPSESIQVFVDFLPNRSGKFEATLDFLSNDEFNPKHTVNLVGLAAPGKCPEPVIIARHPERTSATANPNGTFLGLPLDTLAFDASSSRAFDGREIQKYSWSLTSRPTDSNGVLENTRNDENGMFLDLAGEYVIELEVWDSDNIRSCQPARMIVKAIADEDIHIQLVWDTPNDPDQLDANGSDVDLHLLNPRGRWNERPYDCFWQNLNPDWGSRRPNNADFCPTPTSPGCQDDPSLDIDDVDGQGPENINMDNPKGGISYGVGVHYFADHGYGMSRATVRIFIGGLLEREFLRQPMSDEEFWYVADISWPAGDVNARGGVFPSFPSN